METFIQEFYCSACGEATSEDEFPLDRISPSPNPAIIWQCPKCMTAFEIYIAFKALEGTEKDIIEREK